jgi:hypothetical protein
VRLQPISCKSRASPWIMAPGGLFLSHTSSELS